MKKSLVLGVAALATVTMATPQDSNAGEIKFGGYYMFRVQDSYSTIAKKPDGIDNARYWVQRIQVNTDFIHDKKTHAHMSTRILDSQTVEGANAVLSDAHNEKMWSVRRLWLETDLWGIGLKVGHMPISLNDAILVATHSKFGGFGTIMLSKTFGDFTLVLADVRIDESNKGGRSENDDGRITTDDDGKVITDGSLGYGADEDDEDLYVASLFGKVNPVDFNLTVAYWQTGDDSSVKVSTPGADVNNTWLAATLHSDLGVADVTGTIIYEDGFDGVGDDNIQDAGDGFLAALRVKGDIPQVGGWNAYSFWASEDFTNIINDEMKWSKTWDMGGPGAKDLMEEWSYDAGGSPSENMAGIGVGLKIKVDAFTINPMLDYAAVVEEDADGKGGADHDTTSAWGGTLQVSTKLNKATSLYLTGVYVDPDDEGNADNESLHFVEASVKMKF